MLSTQGGMDIEEVAEEDPDAIATLHVDPLLGFQDFHGRRLAFEAGVDADLVRPIGAFLHQLYGTFVVRGGDARRGQPADRHARPPGRALDAKVTLDDNALLRHPDNAELRDPSAEDPQEQMAKERGLTYVKLDGDIGILGNGAGLVMSTLDVVAQYGGAPGELPRRGRRLEGRGDHQRGRGRSSPTRTSRPCSSTSSAASRAATRSPTA